MREQFIDTSLQQYKPEAEKAFWQEPTFMVGGMAVSFGLGALLVVALKK